MIIKNRGAITNPEGRFEKETRENFDDGWQRFFDEDDASRALETLLLPEKAKTIISKNDSPDLSFDQSINPYRGCEHGCIYCYARPSHAYVNLSPGLDFETKIFYKVDADKLLENEITKKNYECKTIVLGANTDPYQPFEAKLQITRRILEVLNDYNHPVAIITKNALIERDLDILEKMAEKNLIAVAVSVTSLSTNLKRILEPRTSAPSARLRAITSLTKIGVPVRAMVAPIIPLINDMELEKILYSVSQSGARHASYVLIRLPFEVKELFKEWLKEHFPERADHVMSLIRQMRGGKDYDSTYGKRMRGEGEFADLIEMRFNLACKKYKLNLEKSPRLDTSKLRKIEKLKKDNKHNKPGSQLELF